MRFMNEFDIDQAITRHASHPVLGPAVETLVTLYIWTNDNSDGWAYWPKPARAAAKLMELLEGDGTNDYQRQLAATPEVELAVAYRKALTPIKALRTTTTKNGMPSFIISEYKPS
jgi:hypothetical protein